jgi:hypothetical protein
VAGPLISCILEMAIASLELCRYLAEPLHLRIHEDGTLTASDREKLEAGLDRFEFIPRAEADKRMADLFGNLTETSLQFRLDKKRGKRRLGGTY